jgi:hypothetical protein
MIATVKRILKHPDFIETCICIIIAVPISVLVGINAVNVDWFGRPGNSGQYSPTIITAALMAEAGERYTEGASVINERGKELRDALSQRTNIDDLRLLRQIHAAEEKAFMENMRK